MFAIFKKELRAYFINPVGYVYTGVFLAASALICTMTTLQQASYSTSSYFQYMLFTFIILIPLLTMRMFSEEKRQRTDQALYTAPVSLMGIVAGKFLATYVFFAMTLSITLVYGLVIASQTTPDWMVIFGNFFGLLLLGGVILAAGLFFSSLTESQLIAVIVTIAFSLALILVDALAGLLTFSPWLSEAVAFFSVNTRYIEFTKGLISYDNVFYFLSLQVLFLFLTTRMLDAKRWN